VKKVKYPKKPRTATRGAKIFKVLSLIISFL
jgi:hypothetical protein